MKQIYCKLPNGLSFLLYAGMFTLAGANRSEATRSNLPDHGVTRMEDAEWEELAATYAEHPAIKNGFIFESSQADAGSKGDTDATGMAQLDPDSQGVERDKESGNNAKLDRATAPKPAKK